MNPCRNVWGVTDVLVDPGPPGDTAHDPARGVTVHTLAARGHEHGPSGVLADGEVEGPGERGCERHGDDLAALTDHGDGAVPALETQVVDVKHQRLRHA
jgi:hypothetical protein